MVVTPTLLTSDKLERTQRRRQAEVPSHAKRILSSTEGESHEAI